LGDLSGNKAAKANFHTTSSGGRKHEDDENSKQRQQKKVARQEVDTVCRVFWRLAGFELLFVRELSQKLPCGLAKKAVEITNLYFTFYIHRYTNIQNQVYGDIYLIKKFTSED